MAGAGQRYEVPARVRLGGARTGGLGRGAHRAAALYWRSGAGKAMAVAFGAAIFVGALVRDVLALARLHAAVAVCCERP